MKIVIVVLKVFYVIWFLVAGLAIAGGAANIWINEGFSKVQEIFSPFNVINYIVIIITLLPGCGAYLLVQKLSKKDKV